METFQNFFQAIIGIAGLAICNLFIFGFLFFIKSSSLEIKETKYKDFLQRMKNKQDKS